MPQAIGFFVLNLFPSAVFAGIVGAVGFTGAGVIALGIGAGVLYGASLLLVKQQKPPTQNPSDVQTNIRQEISARRRIYGTTLTGSVIIFGFRRGEKSYVLHYICEGPIKSFVSFRMDKKPITLDADGFVEQDQYEVDDRSRVQILTKIGTMSDGPFDELLEAFPELNTPLTPFRHRGCVVALQIVEQVPQEDLQTVYPNNMPGLQFLIEGYDDVYDPRAEERVFSDNAACCLLSEIMDVYGLTEDDSDDINFESFSTFANHCDELVGLKAGGTEKRYRCAGQINMNAENESRVQAIAMICNADVYMDPQGRIAVRQKMRSTPGIALRAKNGDHLELQLESGRSMQKLFNTARFTYVEPALNYKANEVSWRHEGLIEDDGQEYSEAFEGLLCPSGTQGQRLAKLSVFEGNPEFAGSLSSGPQALDLMDDYVFTLDLSPEDVFERVACATGAIEYDADGMTVNAPITIFAEGATVWDPAVDEQEDLVLPLELPSNVDDVALTVTVTVDLLANSAPVLKFSWAAAGGATLPDSYAQQVQVSAADAEEWEDATANQKQNTAVFGPVADGGAYDWRIRNIASGKTFDWQYSTTPVTVLVNAVAPLALADFVPSAAAPHLGGVQFVLTTRSDANLKYVRIYRKAVGVPLDLAVDTPISQPLYLGPLSTYPYVDGDISRVNLVSNPGFDTDTVWTKQTGWTISGGKANKATSAANAYITQTLTLATGVKYRGGYSLSGVTAGTFVPALTGGTIVFGTSVSANGSYLFDIIAVTGNNAAGLRGNPSAVGSLDDFLIFAETPSSAPQGVWDYYAVPFNSSNVAGPSSGPLTLTIV